MSHSVIWVGESGQHLGTIAEGLSRGEAEQHKEQAQNPPQQGAKPLIVNEETGAMDMRTLADVNRMNRARSQLISDNIHKFSEGKARDQKDVGMPAPTPISGPGGVAERIKSKKTLCPRCAGSGEVPSKNGYVICPECGGGGYTADTARDDSKSLLQQARAAIASGDLRRCDELLDKAYSALKDEGAGYELQELYQKIKAEMAAAYRKRDYED